ncbi:MAG TPA: hypothetical protein VK741_09775 [Acetobacteraceae bacterium]|nr:hypothetical protein [Acetobacteraceae bacterium]
MNSGRWPMVANFIMIRDHGDAGLIWKAGIIPLLTIRIASMIIRLKFCSAQFSAALLFQKSMRRCQTGRSPLAKAYQTRAAQTAPPEVPLMLTMSTSSPMSVSQSALRAPAVKAVWLPPPWQAIATRVFAMVVVSEFLSGPLVCPWRGA